VAKVLQVEYHSFSSAIDTLQDIIAAMTTKTKTKTIYFNVYISYAESCLTRKLLLCAKFIVMTHTFIDVADFL